MIPSLPEGLVGRTEAARKALAERRLALREIEGARRSAEEAQSEINFFSTPQSFKEMEQANAAQQNAIREKRWLDCLRA
jgi:hypothetical protein